jgi:hypothetical protein
VQDSISDITGDSAENASATIFDGWRLPARLSLTSYSFTAFFNLAQSVCALAVWVLCLMSALWVLKIHKHSLFVHLNPIKQDPLGGAWLISEKTMNIPSNRNFCNDVTERISSTLNSHCQSRSVIPEIFCFEVERNRKHLNHEIDLRLAF